METVIREAFSIWVSGGWAMIALAVNGFILFWLGLSIKQKLMGKQVRRLNDRTCQEWVTHPSRGRGAVGELVRAIMHAGNLRDLDMRFREFRHVEIAPFERDLRIMRVCVSASPLLGLLGTVTGMLTTFHALAVGSGGQKTMDMVAGGISEALITTETGLIIALPGLLFLHHLQQHYERYDVLLTHVETLCAQGLHRNLAAVARQGVPTAAAPATAPRDVPAADREEASRPASGSASLPLREQTAPA